MSSRLQTYSVEYCDARDVPHALQAFDQRSFQGFRLALATPDVAAPPPRSPTPSTDDEAVYTPLAAPAPAPAPQHRFSVEHLFAPSPPHPAYSWLPAPPRYGPPPGFAPAPWAYAPSPAPALDPYAPVYGFPRAYAPFPHAMYALPPTPLYYGSPQPSPAPMPASPLSPVSAAPRGVPWQNVLDLDAIAGGGDTRTTVMIKNIPNKMSDRELLAVLDSVVPRAIDFFYLRIDFKTGMCFLANDVLAWR
jgi:hypothetical protein